MRTGASPLDVAKTAYLLDQRPTVDVVDERGGTVQLLDAERRIGEGHDLFVRASERLMTWQVHRDAGLVVRASAPDVAVDVVAVLTVGRGPFRVDAPVRVVEVVDEPARCGFTYATLPGHPERGEETFSVELDDRGDVVVHVTAFSEPDRWYSRVGAPLARRVQERITARYLDTFA